jgi:hypothetical protein
MPKTIFIGLAGAAATFATISAHLRPRAMFAFAPLMDEQRTLSNRKSTRPDLRVHGPIRPWLCSSMPSGRLRARFLAMSVWTAGVRREKRSSVDLNATAGVRLRRHHSHVNIPSIHPKNKYTVTFQHPGIMDRQTLSNSLSNKSAVTVAAIFGVTRRTIYRWCKKYDVPRRVYGCPDRELLCRLEADCVFQKHIALKFGVSRWTVRLWCKKFGIAHHTTGHFLRGRREMYRIFMMKFRSKSVFCLATISTDCRRPLDRHLERN